MKLEKEQDLLSSDLLKLLTKIVEQNNILIKNTEAKQSYIIELLETIVDDAEEDSEEDELSEIYRTLD